MKFKFTYDEEEKIPMIKCFRYFTGLGLRESKRIVADLKIWDTKEYGDWSKFVSQPFEIRGGTYIPALHAKAETQDKRAYADLHLWLITTSNPKSEFCSAVVLSQSEEDALKIHPSHKYSDGWEYDEDAIDAWGEPDEITALCVGRAEKGLVEGEVVCAQKR